MDSEKGVRERFQCNESINTNYYMTQEQGHSNTVHGDEQGHWETKVLGSLTIA